MSAEAATTVTLRALEGEPLSDPRICEMVIATAHSIAERQGVMVLRIDSQPDSITVALNVGRIESIGFAAELRRLTTRWYTQKHGVRTLWGEPMDEGEEWKRR